jgi:ATP-dependent helicase HrpB
VLATNVAESSLTIENITAVVDTGLVRVLRFDSGVGLDRLELMRVSRASADQRAGRAGRTAPGVCVRLWSEHEDRALRASEEPEVARIDLSRAVLELHAWGEPDAGHFAWFDAPAPSAIEAAETLLADLGAMDERGLTTTGRLLAKLPLPPRIGRLLVEAARLGCLRHASLAAAILTERDPLRRGRDAASLRATTTWESDLLERVLVVERFAAAPHAARRHGPSSTPAQRRRCCGWRAISRRRCEKRGRPVSRILRKEMYARIQARADPPKKGSCARCWRPFPIAWHGVASAAATVP